MAFLTLPTHTKYIIFTSEGLSYNIEKVGRKTGELCGVHTVGWVVPEGSWRAPFQCKEGSELQ